MFKNKIYIPSMDHVQIAKLYQHLAGRDRQLTDHYIYFTYDYELDYEFFEPLFINVEVNHA